MSVQQGVSLLAGGLSTFLLGWGLYKNTIFYVDTGHRAIKFNKLMGIREEVFREGWHIKWPYFERPIIYDVRTHPTVIKSMTGSKDLQMINISLRVLYRPDS